MNRRGFLAGLGALAAAPCVKPAPKHYGLEVKGLRNLISTNIYAQGPQPALTQESFERAIRQMRNAERLRPRKYIVTRQGMFVGWAA